MLTKKNESQLASFLFLFIQFKKYIRLREQYCL